MFPRLDWLGKQGPRIFFSFLRLCAQQKKVNIKEKVFSSGSRLFYLNSFPYSKKNGISCLGNIRNNQNNLLPTSFQTKFFDKTKTTHCALWMDLCLCCVFISASQHNLPGCYSSFRRGARDPISYRVRFSACLSDVCKSLGFVIEQLQFVSLVF